MTDEELAAIEARLNAATPGPWVAQGIAVRGPMHIDDWSLPHLLKYADAEFIAHARTDVETLLAEVRRLHKFTPY